MLQISVSFLALLTNKYNLPRGGFIGAFLRFLSGLVPTPLV